MITYFRIWHERYDDKPQPMIALVCLDCGARTNVTVEDLGLANGFLWCDACLGAMVPESRLRVLDIGHIMTMGQVLNALA